MQLTPDHNDHRPRHVVVTGAASGIGAATAELLARRGHAVVLADLDEVEGAKHAARLVDDGLDARFVTVDISDEESVVRLYEAVAEDGPLDALINVAGFLRSGDVTQFDVADWDQIFATNVRGPFLMVKHGVPSLRVGTAPAIVSVSSLAYCKAAPGHVAYAASKGALVSFTSTLAAELSPDGIRVNAIAPGWVDTPFNDPAITHMGGADVQAALIAATVPMRRQGTPAEIAEVIAFAASPAASFMTGQTILVDGGASV